MRADAVERGHENLGLSKVTLLADVFEASAPGAAELPGAIPIP